MVYFLLVQSKVNNVKEACTTLVAKRLTIANIELYYKPVC